MFIGLLLLLFWLPLPLGSNRPWAWGIMELWSFSLLFIWLWQYLRANVTITPTFIAAKPILLCFGCWCLYLGIQCLPLPYEWVAIIAPPIANFYQLAYQTTPNYIPLTLDQYASFDAFLQTMSYFSLFVLVLLLVDTHKKLYLLALVMFYSAVFQAVYGSFMTLSGLEYSFFIKKQYYLEVATGTFVNRNHLAAYLEMGLAIGLGLFLSQFDGYQRKKSSWRERLKSIIDMILGRKLQFRFALLILVIALILTRSRMGNTAFVLSLVISLSLYAWYHHSYTQKKFIGFLLLSFLLLDLLLIGNIFGIEQVAERMQQTNLLQEHRDEVNQYTLKIWLDYWWTGSGIGSFYIVFPSYQGLEITKFYDHAHNDYLEFASETGIIGISLLSIIVLSTLKTAIMALKTRHHPLFKAIAFSALMAIIAILIHSTVDFNLHIPANATTFIVCFAMAWISAYLPSQRYQKS